MVVGKIVSAGEFTSDVVATSVGTTAVAVAIVTVVVVDEDTDDDDDNGAVVIGCDAVNGVDARAKVGDDSDDSGGDATTGKVEGVTSVCCKCSRVVVVVVVAAAVFEVAARKTSAEREK